MTIFKYEKLKTKEVPPLLHPPLVEAIFEIRWELQSDKQTGRSRDPSYPMMVGRLYERMRRDFPLVEDLPSTQAHPEATPFVPRHRMRKDKNEFPLLQIGPGILTINHAKGYSWTDFKSLTLRLIESISELFPVGNFPLNFIKAELRYVNGILLDPNESALGFLADKLHMKVELESDLFEQNRVNDRPNALGLNIGFPLQKPAANLGLSVNLGQFEDKPAYLLQTVVQSVGETVPSEQEMFSAWLADAHAAAEHSFLCLCKGDLMKKFCTT